MFYTHIAAAALAAVLAFGGAWKIQNGRFAEKEVKRQDAARELATNQRKTANTASGGHEADRTQIQTQFITITEETERVVNQIEYRDKPCLDADGLRNLNAAVRASADPAQPGHAVPATP